MSDTKKILEQYKNNEISLEEALLEFKKLTDKKYPLEILAVMQTVLKKWITIKTNRIRS